MPETEEQSAQHAGLQTLFGKQDDSGTVSLASIRARARRQLSKFGALVAQQLEEAKINCPPPLSLVSTPDGIRLENEHPQADTIAGWLNGNVKITKKFKEVEVLFEIVRAAENAGEPVPASTCFHIGLTSAGPIAYFEGQPQPAPAE